MTLFLNIFLEAWHLLNESAIYVLFGLLVSGLLRMFLSPGVVARHLGRGRFSSVFKSALLGIPVPLCSCGVLPAAASLKKQGANNGATTAFLISTPESGVDSMAITYALLDPLMTVARPVAAFITATVAGITENLFPGSQKVEVTPDLSCPVDGCCDGHDCPPDIHKNHHSMVEKIRSGFVYAAVDIWGDLARWFFLGLLLAGVISASIPDTIFERYLGSGLPAMLIMLGVGIPLYICATASTPIAAALILKGVSPGAALVFLLAGPATNMTSLTVLTGVLGRRATAIYLTAIAVMSVLLGLALDQVYSIAGISAQAVAGAAAEVVPAWVEIPATFALLALSVKPLLGGYLKRFLSDHSRDACHGNTLNSQHCNESSGST
jgi:uncharacterized membrane protein YraQ (UPF0718 family)